MKNSKLASGFALKEQKIAVWKEQERLAQKGCAFLENTSRHADALALSREEAVCVGRAVETSGLLTNPNILRWQNVVRPKRGLCQCRFG